MESLILYWEKILSWSSFGNILATFVLSCLEHKGTIDITTDRLVLRKFRISDAEEIFATWTS
jgi:hypothetical protein